jgi:hypothetical protein
MGTHSGEIAASFHRHKRCKNREAAGCRRCWPNGSQGLASGAKPRKAHWSAVAAASRSLIGLPLLGFNEARTLKCRSLSKKGRGMAAGRQNLCPLPVAPLLLTPKISPRVKTAAFDPRRDALQEACWLLQNLQSAGLSGVSSDPGARRAAAKSEMA